MFKIVKNSTWEAKEKEVRNLKNDLQIVKEREEKLKVSNAERGEKIQSLQTEKDACRAMRHDIEKKLETKENDNKQLNHELDGLRTAKRDLNKQVESLKADLTKQGNELVVAKDQVKQLQRSVDRQAKTINEFEGKFNDQKVKLQIADDNYKGLVSAVQSAISEMKKTRKGRTSLNNVAALKILSEAIGQK